MNFKELDTVILLHDFPSERLKKGDKGVIVSIYTNPNEAYEVEFADKEGITQSLLVLLPSDFRNCSADYID